MGGRSRGMASRMCGDLISAAVFKDWFWRPGSLMATEETRDNMTSQPPKSQWV